MASPSRAAEPEKAKPAAPGKTAVSKISIPYERYTLPNGLEVILHVDKRLPVVAVNVWYHVGAYHEVPGRSGFAHLFEHMMFQGSGHVADDRHFSLLEEIGASDINGTTDFDRTNYFETVPSNHLETGLWLEADRMGFLLDALSGGKLDNQREVVKNERRQSTETVPYGLAGEKFWQTLFPAPHPYYGAVIGSMQDLGAASLDDVKSFFRTWYAPSNATLTVAGDIDPAVAKKAIEKYFASLPSAPKPKAPEVPQVKIEKETVIQFDEPVAQLPAVFMGWHTAPAYKDGDATAQLLAAVLTQGKASRLQRRLVREKQLAQSVKASQQSLGAQSVFGIQAIARPGVTAQALQKEIDAVMQDIRTKGITADELRRAKDRLETDAMSSLQTVGGFSGKANVLQEYNHFLGEPDSFAKDLERYRKVTLAQVQALAKEQLDNKRRVMLMAVPVKAEAAPASKPQASREVKP
jgi:predicted Zn-dependent peptidase